jgi:predicted 3-demethylubiquinone-9 3-methyltransferase (glyoxalase superfamily)
MKAHSISPCLWLDDQAEAAARFYTSIFPDSEIVERGYYTEEGIEFHGKPAGSVMTVLFRLNGYDFTALNGGPQFKFNEAISLQVYCETQEEIDHYWYKLSGDGGKEGPCGWLTDKFGVSWQIVPTLMIDMMKDPERTKAAQRVVFQMKRPILEDLKNAQ